MDSLPIWAIWSTIPGVVVLAPVLSLSLAVAVVTIIGLLKEVGAPAACTVVAGAIGRALFRRLSSHPEAVPQLGREQISDEAAIAAPPI
jgi:hypothetical protein